MSWSWTVVEVSGLSGDQLMASMTGKLFMAPFGSRLSSMIDTTVASPTGMSTVAEAAKSDRPSESKAMASNWRWAPAGMAGIRPIHWVPLRASSTTRGVKTDPTRPGLTVTVTRAR
jgi:hypothetical protein